MRPVRRFVPRLAARVALAATIALACATAAATAVALASTPPVPHLTYIVGLGTSNPQAVVSNVDGSGPVMLGQATSALLSPDGTQVAAIDTGTSSTLTVYPSAGGTPRVLPTSKSFMQLLAWSPDSKLLLVAVGTTPRGKLIVFDVAASPVTSTTIATGVLNGASFDPGGGADAIVYSLATNAAGTSFNLFLTTPSGTPTRQLTHDNHSKFPVWGQHGIAFSRLMTPAKGGTPMLQLWFIKPGGGGLRQLTNVTDAPAKSTGLTPIAFSADGEHLLANYIGPNLNWHEAYVLDLSRPKPQPRDLTGQNDGTTIGDAMSVAGGLVLATTGTSSDQAALSIEEFKWSGGKPTVLAKSGAYASWNL